MPVFPKPYADIVQRLRVPGGFAIAAALLAFARPTVASVLYSLPVALAGIGLRAWAAGHLRKNQQLTVSGPYGWLRNPLYLGSLLMVAGFVIASRQPLLALLAAAVFLLIYWPVMEQEEQHLRKLFPEFATYAARVPMLVPKPPGTSSPLPFSLEQFRRNQEWKAFLAWLIGCALLLVRAMSS